MLSFSLVRIPKKASFWNDSCQTDESALRENKGNDRLMLNVNTWWTVRAHSALGSGSPTVQSPIPVGHAAQCILLSP